MYITWCLLVVEHLFVLVFVQLGLETRAAVGIIGFNSAEWFISDLGAIFAG
jgi:long-subunit acyl-CoA synthetase (AMP-forming)